MKKLLGRGQGSAVLLSLAVAVGCSGDGCNCLGPIPGGFPPDDRVPNLTQVRVTPTGLDALESDPARLVSGVLGTPSGEAIEFEPPPSCGSDPRICCPDDTPSSPCGPLEIDLAAMPGDAPRLEILPQEGQSQIDLIVRARIRTVNRLPVSQSGVDCEISVDSARGDDESVTVDSVVQLSTVADTNTTRVEITEANVDIESDDVEIHGGILCDFADAVKPVFLGLVTGEIEGLLRDAITGGLCKTCPSGDVAECGPLADACEEGTCIKGDDCLQELGISGRLEAGALLGSVSVGQLGALDLYEVAGGYTGTDDGGISLGVLGGMLPAGTARDRCGPPSTPPAEESVPISPVFEGNTHPVSGDPFDVGVGIHAHTLDLFSWAAYESGLLCLNIGTRTAAQLTTDTLSILFPSIVDVTHDGSAQIVLGLRPQSPPDIVLGQGTTTEEGGETVIEDPLLDVSFEDLEIDFFAMIDDQFVRIMTLTADVRLPLNLEANADGEIEPVLGDVEEAFTDIRVSNSEALEETPEELAAKAPLLINLALPLLGGALGGFALPELAGVKLEIAPGGITSVDDETFLAIFANLDVSSASPRVITEAELGEVRYPDDRVATARGLEALPRRSVELSLGGQSPGDAELEWSYRVDGGLWSPFTRLRQVSVDWPVLALPGEHRIEVRARELGRPNTTDRSPAVVRVGGEPPQIDDRGRPVLGFHGQDSGGGCQCRASAADPQSAAGTLLLLALGCLGLARRPRRSRASGRWIRAAAAATVALAIAMLPACSCGGVKCEGGKCLEGEVERGPTGRYSSIASDDGRIVIAAYDQKLGDLVLIEAPELSYTVVDGVPGDVLPIYHPKGYRGGIEKAGPDVGAWTSVKLRGGRARISYQDRDLGALKYAAERKRGDFQTHIVDGDTGGGQVGLYSALSFDGSGAPGIAYLAVGVNDPAGDGRKLTQLRFARASKESPSSGADWSVEVVDEALISCAGLCAEGTTCIADESGGDPVERCAATETSCGDSCTDTEACVGGACVTAVADPPAHDIAQGVGLFVNHLSLPDGRTALVYYDRTLGDLILQVKDGDSWTRHELSAAPETDTGMWASAAVDLSGAIHIAYQDAIGDRMLYTTWADGEVGPVEVVDDGTRAGDERTHPVGASAALFLDSGGIGVAYQDGLTGDLVIARRGDDGTWENRDLLAGPTVYGFHVHATTRLGRTTIASYFYDRTVFPPGELAISTVP